MERRNRAASAWRVLAVVSSAMGICASVVLSIGPAQAQNVESWIVKLDAASSQPVRSGFTPQASGGNVIVFAEGALRSQALPNRLDEGWFGPAGQTNWFASDQPIADGMPYGALVGAFGPTIPQAQFLGRMGAFSVQPANVGQEFRLALNLSDADMAALEGELTVVLIHVPQGSEEVAEVAIHRHTPLPINTGIFAESDGNIVVLPYGALRDPQLANSAYTDGWFGAEGLLGLISPSQPYIEAPYGALQAKIGLSSVFLVGDGVTWRTAGADEGGEVQLMLNLDPAAQPGLEGRLIVHVVRLPPPDLTSVPDERPAGHVLRSVRPNPSAGPAAVGFALPRETHARLRVYDARGRWVRSLVDATLPAGAHEAVWDGNDDDGRRLPAGAYFVQLATAAGSWTERVIRIE